METFILNLLEVSVSVSIVVLILKICSGWMDKNVKLKWRYYLWLFLAVRLMIPLNLSVLPKNYPGINIPHEIVLPQSVPVTEEIIPIDEGFKGEKIPTVGIMFCIWLAGMFIYYVQLIFTYQIYKRKVLKNAEKINDIRIIQSLTEIKSELVSERNISVMYCRSSYSPMIFGVRHPCLFIPKKKYTGEELYFILKHELIHFKRRDILYKLVLQVANGMHWFNPLVYMLVREADICTELFCDEEVVRGKSYEEKQKYTEIIMDSLEYWKRNSYPFTTHFYGSKKEIKKRFDNILSIQKKEGWGIFISFVVLTLGISLLTVCSVREEKATIKTAESGNALSEDSIKLRQLAAEFAKAYFSGDKEAVKPFLVDDYAWDIEVYTGSLTDIVEAAGTQGFNGTEHMETGDTAAGAFVYKDAKTPGYYTRLMMDFIKTDQGWKITYYGKVYLFRYLEAG